MNGKIKIISLVIMVVVFLFLVNSNNNPSAEDFSQFFENSQLRDFNPSVMESYESKDELINDIKAIGYEIAKIQIENMIYWFNSYGYRDDLFLINETSNVGGMDLAVQEDSQSKTEGGDGYQTNTQVDGIDEGDSIKSDGQFIYLLYGQYLISLSLEGKILSRIKLEDEYTFSHLYISEGSLYALGTSYSWYDDDFGRTLIKKIKINSGMLEISENLDIKGDYTNSRVFNNKLYIITNRTLDYYGLDIYSLFPENITVRTSPDVLRKVAYAKLETVIDPWANEIYERIFKDDLETDPSFLQNLIRPFSAGEIDYSQAAYDSWYYWQVPTINSFQKVTTVELGNSNLSIAGMSGAFTSGYGWSNIYMNEDILATASNGWIYDSNGNWQTYTDMIVFSIDEDCARAQSVFQVDGYLLNQFSMDYYDGYLRLAVTRQPEWSWSESQGWIEENPSSSYIHIVDVSQPNGEIVSTLGGIGETEIIYSVRFMADRAYVVTFRQMDPFYTLDLSDPYHPEVKGELKIPGFSNYLHPVDEDHILAVGQDTDDQGFVTGVQVAMFDVSDFENPVQLYKYSDNSDSYTDAQWDHHAFRYIPSKKMLILPVFSYEPEWNGNYYYNTYFRIYSVSVEKGISSLATVFHNRERNYNDLYDNYNYGWLAGRSMVFGDQLITSYDSSIYSHELYSWEEQWHIYLAPRK